MQYTALVQDYFDHPRGVCAGGDESNVGCGEAGSMATGTWVQVRATVQEQLIAAICFRAYGCPHTIAACGRVCEQLQGQPAECMLEIDPAELQRELELPVEKAGKILILQDALSDCYQNWKSGT